MFIVTIIIGGLSFVKQFYFVRFRPTASPSPPRPHVCDGATASLCGSRRSCRRTLVSCKLLKHKCVCVCLYLFWLIKKAVEEDVCHVPKNLQHSRDKIQRLTAKSLTELTPQLLSLFLSVSPWLPVWSRVMQIRSDPHTPTSCHMMQKRSLG